MLSPYSSSKKRVTPYIKSIIYIVSSYVVSELSLLTVSWNLEIKLLETHRTLLHVQCKYTTALTIKKKKKKGNKSLKIKHWKSVFWRCISSDSCPTIALDFCSTILHLQWLAPFSALLYAFPTLHHIFRSMLTSCMSTFFTLPGPEQVFLEPDSTWKVQINCVQWRKKWWEVETLQYRSLQYRTQTIWNLFQHAAQMILTYKIDTCYPLPLCPLLWGH